MSTSEDVENALAPIMGMFKKSTGLYSLLSRDGRLVYVGYQSAIIVENPFTMKLPDFIIDGAALEALWLWCKALPTRTPLTIKKVRKQLILASENFLFSADVHPNDLSYTNIEDAFTLPKLTNNYRVEIPQSLWEPGIESMASLLRVDEARAATFVLEAVKDGFSLSASAPSGRSAEFYGKPVSNEEIPEKGFRGTYNFKPLLAYMPSTSDNVVLSFKEHEKNDRSTLVVSYENGVTVVLAPYWD